MTTGGANVTVDQAKLVLNSFAAIFQNNLTSAELVTWRKFDNEMNDRNRIKKKLIDTYYMGDYRVTNSFVASFRSFFIKSGEMSIKTNERNLRTNAAARFRSGTVRSFVRIIENSLTRNPWSAWNNKNCVIYCLYTARVVSN